jgi:hypothetical protein
VVTIAGRQQCGAARAERGRDAAGAFGVDAFGDLVHVLQGDAVRGGGQVDALQEPPGGQLGGAVVRVHGGQDAVGGGGPGVHGPGLLDPAQVPRRGCTGLSWSVP